MTDYYNDYDKDDDEDNNELVFSEDAHERENDPTGVSWGGYMAMDTWNSSCGNLILTDISDGCLPFKHSDEMSYWIKLIQKTFKKYKLGNLFLSFPSDVKTGKPLKDYGVIAEAMEKAGFKRIARAVNPYHYDHFQDTYKIHG